MSPDAYVGLAGEVVRTIEPHTESDSAALLLQFLTCFGNAVGRGPHFRVEGDQHFTVLNIVLVGATAKSRKGTSSGRIREIFKVADGEWELNSCQNRSLVWGGANQRSPRPRYERSQRH